jgi:uncharacterized alpha-E superfamily protein
VDLILRRVDADFCDPLELRNESLLGVPGLVQAARTGQVVLVNSLGAGLLESPSLSPFFPALCRHLLHEELKLPAVAGWWCGQRRELNFVLENLETLILQPAHSLDPRARVFGPRLDAAEREQWRERLRAEPAAWCARERLALATTPVLAAGRLAPHPFQLRAFLVSSGGECHLMPGGLTRIPADANDLSVSMQQGGSSKDTWVLPPAESPVPADLTPAATAAVSPRLRRQTVDMPSRVADNLFWLGRYLERAESQARVLRLLVAVLTEEGAAAAPAAVLPFFHHLAFNATPRLLASTTPPALDLAAAERHLRSLLWEEVSEHSLLANTNRLETAAYRVKERLSSDAWQLLGRLRRLRRAPAAAPVFDGGAYGDLNDVIAVLAAVSGLIMENMTRGHGWIFLDLGRRLERGLQLAHLLHQALVPFSPPADLLQNLLVCGDSQLTYRRRYLTHLQPVLVLDLLACDESNPRSLAFQLRAVREHVAELPRSAGDDLPRAPERLALSLYCQIRLAEIGPLSQEDATGARPTLGTFLGSLARDLAALSLAVEQLYFSHGESPADD